ncbi:MAG: DMT family transporter [Cyanophyceae cyanobacterium]
MSKFAARASVLLDRVPGRAYLLTAIMLFAAANAVVRQLTLIGETNLVDGRNPISFCNVLFVGNLCALFALIPLYYRQWSPRHLQSLSPQDWLGMSGVALLSGTLAPALTFIALDITTVNNVILIGRIGPPLSLALSVLLLKERVNGLIMAGAVVAFGGVVLTILLQPASEPMMTMAGLEIGRGELLAVVGAIALAVSTIISKAALGEVPLGIFSIFRTALGTVIFWVAAVILYGPEHFRDVFSPLLWQWMLVYGIIIVASGQVLLYTGLRRTTTSDYSLASSFSPIAGILAAALILGETPTAAQYIGGSVILIGIMLNQLGISRRQASEVARTAAADDMETAVGFKGV